MYTVFSFFVFKFANEKRIPFSFFVFKFANEKRIRFSFLVRKFENEKRKSNSFFVRKRENEKGKDGITRIALHIVSCVSLVSTTDVLNGCYNSRRLSDCRIRCPVTVMSRAAGAHATIFSCVCDNAEDTASCTPRAHYTRLPCRNMIERIDFASRRRCPSQFSQPLLDLRRIDFPRKCNRLPVAFWSRRARSSIYLLSCFGYRLFRPPEKRHCC